MDLFEYQAKALFAKHDVPTTPGRVADTAEEAEKVAAEIGNRAVILAHHSLVTCNCLRRYTVREYVDFVFDFVRAHDLRAIVLLVPDEGMTAAECAEVARIARERAALV